MGGNWLLDEFERARQRSARIPVSARPVVVLPALRVMKCEPCASDRHHQCRKLMYGDRCDCGCRGYFEKGAHQMKGHICELPESWVPLVAVGTTFTCAACDRLWFLNENYNWQSEEEG